MIKKLAPALFLLFVFPSFVFAQDFDFNRANSDYLYNLSLYREAHQEYVSAKEAYLKYKTLTSKNTALEKTLRMTQLRDEVVRTYLIALKMKLGETPGIFSDDKNVFNLKLDNEADWYLKHKEELSSAATLGDLANLAKVSSTRYSSRSEILIYQTLYKILLGKEFTLKGEIEIQIEAIREKLKEIKEKGDKDISLPERWLLETENRLLRFEEKVSASQAIMASIEKNTYRESVYRKAQLLLEEGHQYLKEANRYLKEIIREIKTADGNY